MKYCLVAANDGLFNSLELRKHMVSGLGSPLSPTPKPWCHDNTGLVRPVSVTILARTLQTKRGASVCCPWQKAKYGELNVGSLAPALLGAYCDNSETVLIRCPETFCSGMTLCKRYAGPLLVLGLSQVALAVPRTLPLRPT